MKAAITFGAGWSRLIIAVDTKDIGKVVEAISKMEFIETHYKDGAKSHYMVDDVRKIEIDLIDVLLPAKPAEE